MSDLAQKSIEILENDPPKQKRYYGLDAMKGFGIWVMILIHCLIQQEAEFESELFINTIQNISPWWIPLIAPIAILSIWGPFFAFAYVTTLSIQILGVVDSKPKEVNKFLIKRLVIGVLILALGKTSATLFSYRFFERGHFTIPNIGIYYQAMVLDLIAWSGFIVPTIIFLLYKVLKVRNHFYLIGILLGLIIVWFAIAPLVISVGNNHVIPWLLDKDLHFLRYLVSKMVQGRFKMFPVLSFGFLGGIYGTMLYNNFDFKKIFYFTLIFFGICVVGFILWHFVNPTWFLDFASEDVPAPLEIASIATMPFLFLVFLHNHDFAKTEVKRVRAAKRTTWWRRYSLISLTAYSLGTDIAYRIFKYFVDIWGPSVDRSGPELLFAWNFWKLISFILTMFVFWEILLRLWEKINYVFSVDWFLVKTVQLFTGQKMARINIKQIIYGPNKHREAFVHNKAKSLN